MSIKSIIRNLCKKNKFLSRQYDKLTWYKCKLNTLIESDYKFAKREYKRRVGTILNLDKPQTYDEKLWWLKLNNHDPLMTNCTDKYLVREYVKSCGLGVILNDLFGVYDNADEIDFSTLPDKCFFKCNHTSGVNRIYDNSKSFDQNDFVKRFNFVLKQNYYVKSREWNYKNIKPKIICEKILEPSNGNIVDYRFLCFDGKVQLLFVDIDTCDIDGSHSSTARRNVYDKDFNLLDVVVTRSNFPSDMIKKPDNYELMKKYAEILSAPFKHCRVDLYNIDEKIYFGEITFYHYGGFNKIHPIEWQQKLGDFIKI